MKMAHVLHETSHIVGVLLLALYWLIIITLTVSFAAFGAYVLAEIFL